jgi:hypothetical protein
MFQKKLVVEVGSVMGTASSSSSPESRDFAKWARRTYGRATSLPRTRPLPSCTSKSYMHVPFRSWMIHCIAQVGPAGRLTYFDGQHTARSWDMDRRCESDVLPGGHGTPMCSSTVDVCGVVATLAERTHTHTCMYIIHQSTCCYQLAGSLY